MVARAYIDFRANLSPLRSGLGQAISLVREAAATMAGVTSGALAAAGIQAGINSAAGLAKTIVGEMINVNAQFEQAAVGLAVLFKSEKTAADMINQIQGMAAKTPFRFQDLTQGIIQLRVFGFHVKELIPMMQKIGDAAAASPRGMEDGVQRISYAFGQMHTAGVVNARHLRMLTEAAVPAWEILAKKMGKSMAQVRADVTAKNIQAAQAIPMLLAGMGEKFGGMMEKQNRTWKGLMSNLLDDTQFFLKDVGKEFFKLSEVRLSKLIDWYEGSSEAKNFKQQITEVVNEVAKFADAKVTQAWDWLKSPDARKFGEQIKDIAKETYRIAGVAVKGLWAILTSSRTAWVAKQVAAIATNMWKIGSVVLTNVIDFLSGDTFAGIVQRAREFGDELIRIGKIGIGHVMKFLDSANFRDLSTEAKKLGGVLVEVFRTVKKYAGEKITQAFDWLRSDNARELAGWMRTIAVEVGRIASISFGHLMEIFGSDGARRFAMDLRDSAQAIVVIAGQKLVELTNWLAHSKDAKDLGDALAWIAKNLVWIVKEFGGLAAGLAVMVQLRPAIMGVTAALTATMSPIGLLQAGLGVLALAFVAAKVDGVSMGEEVCLTFDRITGKANEAGNAVTRFRSTMKGEKENADRNTKNDAMIDAPASEDNLKSLEQERDRLATEKTKAINTWVRAAHEYDATAKKANPLRDTLDRTFMGQTKTEQAATANGLARAKVEELELAEKKIEAAIAAKKRELRDSLGAADVADERETGRALGKPFGGTGGEVAGGANFDWDKSDRDNRSRKAFGVLVNSFYMQSGKDEANRRRKAGEKQEDLVLKGGKEDKDADPGSVRKHGGGMRDQTGVVAFAQQLQASLNKTEAEQAAIDQKDLLDSVIDKGKGIKIANWPKPDVARLS